MYFSPVTRTGSRCWCASSPCTPMSALPHDSSTRCRTRGPGPDTEFSGGTGDEQPGDADPCAQNARGSSEQFRPSWFVRIHRGGTTAHRGSKVPGPGRRGFVLTGARTPSFWTPPPGRLVAGTRHPYHLEASVPGVFVAGDVRSDSVSVVAPSGRRRGRYAVTLVQNRYLEKL